MQNTKYLIAIIFWFSSSLVHAQAIDEFAVLGTRGKVKKVLPKDLSIFTSFIMGGTVSDKTESGATRTATLLLQPTYKVSKKYSVTLSAALTQELEEEQFYTSNTDILFNLPAWSLVDGVSLNVSLGGVLPTDHDGYIDQTFRGGAYLFARLAGKAFANSFPINLSYILTSGQNFHKFRRNNLALPNTEYYVANSVFISKNISNFSLGITGTFAPRWDYGGVYNPLFSISQRVAYSHKGFIYAFTHSNRGGALDYQGDLDNVRVFDDYNSRVNFSLSYNLQ